MGRISVIVIAKFSNKERDREREGRVVESINRPTIVHVQKLFSQATDAHNKRLLCLHALNFGQLNHRQTATRGPKTEPTPATLPQSNHQEYVARPQRRWDPEDNNSRRENSLRPLLASQREKPVKEPHYLLFLHDTRNLPGIAETFACSIDRGLYGLSKPIANIEGLSQPTAALWCSAEVTV